MTGARCTTSFESAKSIAELRNDYVQRIYSQDIPSLGLLEWLDNCASLGATTFELDRISPRMMHVMT